MTNQEEEVGTIKSTKSTSKRTQNRATGQHAWTYRFGELGVGSRD